MKPLDRKEKIYAIALGIGFMMDNKVDGDQNQIIRGLKMLRYLVEDEDRAELQSLCERGYICDDIDFKKVTKEPEGLAELAHKSMHEIPRLERYACIAIAMAKLIKAGGDQFTKPHKRMLKAMVNEEDIKWCQEKLREGLKTCGCEDCQKRLRVIQKTEEVNANMSGDVTMDQLEEIIKTVLAEDETQESAAAPEPETEDPWKAFGA